MSHCHTVTLQFLFDSMALILPQEITDHIIDAIAKSHIPAFSLCSCSLVSKSFSYRSRYHLFREISICAVGENQMLKILQSFLDILISKPIAGCRLLLFIKSFEVEIEGILSEKMDNILTQIMRALHEPNYGVNHFSLGLTRLVNGRYLEMATDWTNLSSEFRRSFLDLTRSPHLSILELCDFCNVPNTLLNGTHIKKLHLYDITFSPSDTTHNTQFHSELNNSDIISLPIPHLEVFATRHPSALCDINGKTTDLSFLCDLKKFNTIMADAVQFDSAWKVMKVAASSLEDIGIDFYEGSLVFKEPFDFGCLPKLQVFTITYSRSSSSLDFDPGVDQICHILRTPSPAQSLNSIEISISLVFGGSNLEYLHPEFEKSSWLILDSLLTGPQYPSLRKLKILLGVVLISKCLDPEIFDCETRRYFSMVLPALSSSKSVKLTFDLCSFPELDDAVV